MERFRARQAGAASGQPETGLLLYGDNFDALSWLLGNGYRGMVRLVYMDPPYNSGRAYRSRVRLRGKGQPTLAEQTVYEDVWQPDAYLQFLADRLLLVRELLHPDGTLWLHCDHRMQAHLLLLLHEIFGAESHLNTIFWRSQTMRGAKVHARYFPRSAQAIHIFRATPQGHPVWNAPTREIVFREDEAAARYMRDERGFFRTSDPGAYSFDRLARLFAEGRLYAPYGGHVIVNEDARQVYSSNGGKIGVKYYLAQRGRNRFVATRAVDNLWDDIAGLGAVPGEEENYPTQKTERLLQRVLETASRSGDLVLDPFVGSGTTLAVAQKLGRRWVGCDSAWRAVRTAASRLSRPLQTAEPLPSGGQDGCNPEDRADGNAAPEGSGYQIWWVQNNGSARGSVPWEQPDANVDMEVRLEGDDDRITVRIVRFHSPDVIRLAAKAKAPLPQDWRTQVRAVLVDPDFDGATLRPSTVDAPTGKDALVTGHYACPRPHFPGREERDHAAERAIAVLIVDVAGEEHLIRTSSRQRTSVAGPRS